MSICGKANDLKWLRVRCAIISGKIIFILRLSRPAGRSKRIFTKRGRSGKRHLQLPDSRPSRSNFKLAEAENTVKRSSRRTGGNLQYFRLEPTSLGLKGASSPFFVDPARRNRWHFSGSLLVSKENISRTRKHKTARPPPASGQSGCDIILPVSCWPDPPRQVRRPLRPAGASCCRSPEPPWAG